MFTVRQHFGKYSFKLLMRQIEKMNQSGYQYNFYHSKRLEYQLPTYIYYEAPSCNHINHQSHKATETRSKA